MHRSRIRSALPAVGALGLILAVALPATLAEGSSVGLPGPPTLPPSTTPVKAIGTLDGTNPLLTFAGAISNPTPLPLVNDPVPVVCALQCREFRFHAPTGVPFLVAVKGTVTGPAGSFNANDGFDLYVYDPSGALVGSENGIGANGQAVTIDAPRRGAYTVVVTFTYAEDPNAAYVGEVRLMESPTWQPAAATCSGTLSGLPTGCYELPVISAVPAYDLAVSGLPPAPSTPLGFPFPVALSTPTSCYVDESFGLDNPSAATLSNPALRCLRFTSDVRDTGPGPLEVALPWFTSSGGSGFVPGGCHASQIVLTASGSTATRPAGDCEFHVEHAHFHYKDLISFELYSVSGGGVGAPVGTSLKESFCLSDDDYFGYGSVAPNGPRNFVGQPGCNVPSQTGADGAFVLEGISPGWGDVYTWDTPDQYIDITHVAPGTYDLVERTNPSGVLLVGGPAQTCALTQLQLTATTVKTLATEDSVACPAP